MFDKNFYPTPIHVLESMGIDAEDKVCYEPSAGKGDIVEYLKETGAKSVIASERNDDLRSILNSKCRVIASNFFDVTSEDISHINLIVMNPPFDNAHRHILHAWDIAPDGCEIISLCNYQTLENDYSGSRRELTSLIKNNGNSLNLGDVFTDAERTTGIEIGLVKLFKPITSEEFDYSGFFMDEEEEVGGEYGIMPHDEVRSLVMQYVGSMKAFDKMEIALSELKNNCYGLKAGSLSLAVSQNDNISDKKDFGKYLQKQAWQLVFDRMKIRKFVTSDMLDTINDFVETQEKIPFTMKNIYHMIDMIIQTRSQNYNKALIKSVDNFTKYTHENRFDVEGWKTNSGHCLNKKIIVDGGAELDKWCSQGSVEIGGCYSRNKAGYLNDLTKVLCYLTGDVYNVDNKWDYMENPIYSEEFEGKSKRRFKPGKWYKFHQFFEFKAFKKGTIHLKFKDVKHWELLNRKYAELKGQSLPEKL